MYNILDTLKRIYKNDRKSVPDMLPKLFQAINDGYIRETPCKPGDDLFLIDAYDKIKQYRCEGFQYIPSKDYNYIYAARNGQMERLPISWVGHRIFLTRESAKIARDKLRKRKGDKREWITGTY